MEVLRRARDSHRKRRIPRNSGLYLVTMVTDSCSVFIGHIYIYLKDIFTIIMLTRPLQQLLILMFLARSEIILMRYLPARVVMETSLCRRIATKC